MRSLRQRLTLALILCSAFVFTVCGTGLYRHLRDLLIREFDYSLAAKLQALTGLQTPGREGFSVRFVQSPPREFQGGPNAEFFEVRASDGSLFGRSPSLQGQPLEFPMEPTLSRSFAEVRLPGGERGRAVAIRLFLETGEAASTDYVVVLARNTSRLEKSLTSLAGVMILGGVLSAVLISVLARRVTTLALRPVGDLASAVNRINVSDLSVRLPAHAVPEELAGIIEQFNFLMKRLQEGFEREQRFSASAAHELLTPISEMRALAQNAIRWPNDEQATASLAKDVLESSSQMERLVMMLLAFARNTNVPLAATANVNVTRLLREALEAVRPTSESRRLQWQVELAELHVPADDERCRWVFRNLLQNAAEHSPEGSSVQCRLMASPERLLCIRNPNPGLSREDLEKVFEPFWRKEKSRTNRAHAGLGLAVAQTAAQSLGWKISASLPTPEQFEVRIHFPAEP